MSTATSQQTAKTAPSTFRRIRPDLIILPSIALILSAGMTWANYGVTDEFTSLWARSFLTCLLILPLVLATLGLIERGVNSVLGAGVHGVARKLVTSVCTAIAIETGLAIAVTLANGQADVSFVQEWWAAFSRSLPNGISICLVMCFYLKPLMDRLRQAAAA